MAELRKKVLKNRNTIVNEVRYVDIHDYLRQEIFDMDDGEEIMAFERNKDKMSKCLDLLLYRGGDKDPFQVFLNSLTDAYSHIKERIENTEIQQEIQPGAGGDFGATSDEEEICTKTMLKLSNVASVMRNWKMLARVLELDEADILEITNRHENNLRECVYQLLSDWKAHQSYGQATNGRLKEALLELGLQEVVGRVFKPETT